MNFIARGEMYLSFTHIAAILVFSFSFSISLQIRLLLTESSNADLGTIAIPSPAFVHKSVP